MKKHFLMLCSFFVLLFCSCGNSRLTKNKAIPQTFLGNFADDYYIRYTVSDSIFLQHPNVRYRILKWNVKEQYIIARNGTANPSDKTLYTRIDYMQFENMEPFTWGFCYTQYKALSAKEAELAAAADRKNPKKGCGGYPFSRLRRAQ